MSCTVHDKADGCIGFPASSSGRRGTADWPNDDQNVKRTKDVLQTLIDDFYVPEYRDTVTAIELLNEPAGFLGGKMMVRLRLAIW